MLFVCYINIIYVFDGRFRAFVAFVLKSFPLQPTDVRFYSKCEIKIDSCTEKSSNNNIQNADNGIDNDKNSRNIPMLL